MTSRVCRMGGYPPVEFKFRKEAFDEIALFIEPGQEAGRNFAICFWQDGQPPVNLEDHCTQPVSIIGAVREQHLTLMDVS